jgi:Amt family ammonium transporter
MAYSFVATLLIALAIKAVMGLRVSEEEEVTGIDQTVHAESGYELSGIGASGASALSSGALATGRGTRPSSVEVH